MKYVLVHPPKLSGKKQNTPSQADALPSDTTKFASYERSLYCSNGGNWHGPEDLAVACGRNNPALFPSKGFDCAAVFCCLPGDRLSAETRRRHALRKAFTALPLHVSALVSVVKYFLLLFVLSFSQKQLEMTEGRIDPSASAGTIIVRCKKAVACSIHLGGVDTKYLLNHLLLKFSRCVEVYNYVFFFFFCE